MTATTQTPDYAALAAKARQELADADSQSAAASNALSAIKHFDKQIQRGALAVSLGDLEMALNLGGMGQLVFNGETELQVREAIRAYGQWLVEVAFTAR